MNFIFWISNKLKLSGKSRANATGVAIAIGGVALSIIIMECALSIVSGFKTAITDRFMGFDGQISVLPAYHQESGYSEESITLSNEVLETIGNTLPGSQTVLKYNMPGLIKTDNDFSAVYFIGYGNGYAYDFEKNAVVDGSLPNFGDKDSQNQIAISKQTASALQLNVGDKVSSVFFVNDAIKNRKFEITGIYDTGFSDYDKTIAFASISALQKIASVDSLSGTQLSVYLPDVGHIRENAAALQSEFLSKYSFGKMEQLYPVDNVRHTGAIFFNWLDLLDTNVVVIFILMSCVAAFTLVSSMFILILDRIPAIGLLRALGSTKSQIRFIFVNLAMKTVGIGLIIGNAIGIGLLMAQRSLHFIKLNPEMYYLPYVPVQFNWCWIVWLNIAVCIAAWLILIVPSRVAAGISPAKTMRFD